MAAQGKGLIVALAMIIITMFGAVTVFQMSHDGIEFSMNVHHITIGGSAGEYSIGASLDIENTNDFDIAIRTAEVEVYQSEAEEHLIFSHSIEQRIALKAGETHNTGVIVGKIHLANDDIPESIWVKITNLSYEWDGRIYNEEMSFLYEFDISDYLP